LSNDYSLRPKEFVEKVKGSRVVKEEAAKGGVEWETNVQNGKYEEGLLVGDLIQVSSISPSPS
jgi:hypothetical protein